MALEINIPTAFGIDVTYHRLVKVYYDFSSKKGDATLACYINQKARLDDNAPLTNYVVPLPEMADLDGQSVYKAIKEHDAFLKAKDV
jgi:hypothetical protein